MDLAAIIDETLQKLQNTNSVPTGTLLNAVKGIISQKQIGTKIEAVMELLSVLIRGKGPDIIEFYRLFCLEEPTAPREIKACGRWYRKIAPERKRLIKEQGEAIHNFSIRLIKIESLIKTLGEATLRPICQNHARQSNSTQTDFINSFSQMENHAPVTKLAELEKQNGKLRFEIESLKEKCLIMRNDLNYALRQRLEVETRLLETNALLEEKRTECSSLHEMIRESRRQIIPAKDPL
jgi:hypothetical protein